MLARLRLTRTTKAANTRFLLHYSQMTMIAKHNKSLYIIIRSVIKYDRRYFKQYFHEYLEAMQPIKISHDPVGKQIIGYA